jgi:hypothetical protein
MPLPILLGKSDFTQVRQEPKTLLEGGSIERQVDENVVLQI